MTEDDYYNFNSPYFRSFKPAVIRNEDSILDTWNSEKANKERDIFGEKEKGLFYNYSDRLEQWDYEKTRRANEYARLVAEPKTARYFTAMLSYFHNGSKVILRHIIAGCNRSNGFPYLVYGYKYEEDAVEDLKRLAEYDELIKVRSQVVEQAVEDFAAKFDETISAVLENIN